VGGPGREELEAMTLADQIRAKSKEASKDEFFAAVGHLNVHPFIVSGRPYVSEWRFLDSHAKPPCGWSIDRGNPSKIDYEYRLPIDDLGERKGR
jgi:hypothetical protein